jgi:hypothetical protein
MEKEKIFGYNEKPIQEKSDKNYQVYHFKFENDLNGLTIHEMTIKGSIIPRLGETININAGFIDHCLCFFNEEIYNNMSRGDDKYAKEQLGCFFPQKENETESDYKHRIYNFINKHFYDCDSEENLDYYLAASYILETIEYISFEVVKINRTFTHESLTSDSIQRIDIYLLGKFETEDFKWE